MDPHKIFCASSMDTVFDAKAGHGRNTCLRCREGNT